MFDSASHDQSVYLDGFLDNTHPSIHPYQGTAGSLTIGFSPSQSHAVYFDGFIDQLSYTNRSKSSQEILRDATLNLYFSFDGNSIYDQGPLGISGSLAGSTCFVSRR